MVHDSGSKRRLALMGPKFVPSPEEGLAVAPSAPTPAPERRSGGQQLPRRSTAFTAPRRSAWQCFHNREVANTVCEASNLLVQHEAVRMSNGGEPITEVRGRVHEDEQPNFTAKSAFVLLQAEGKGGDGPGTGIAGELQGLELVPALSEKNHGLQAWMKDLMTKGASVGRVKGKPFAATVLKLVSSTAKALGLSGTADEAAKLLLSGGGAADTGGSDLSSSGLRAAAALLSGRTITLAQGAGSLRGGGGSSPRLAAAGQAPSFSGRAGVVTTKTGSTVEHSEPAGGASAQGREADLVRDDATQEPALSLASILLGQAGGAEESGGSDAVVFEGCDEVVEETTLFVNRQEYANPFHESTVWYSAHLAATLAANQRRGDQRGAHVVFVDGHCNTPMADFWKSMFLSVRFLKALKPRTCFAHAVFVPLGYRSPLDRGITPRRDCPGSPYLANFRRASLQAMGLPIGVALPSADEMKGVISVPGGPPSDAGPTIGLAQRLAWFDQVKEPVCDGATIRKEGVLRILFVRREDYLAHPRHQGKIVHRLENEAAILAALHKRAEKLNVQFKGEVRIQVINALFASKQVSLREQVRAVRSSCVLFGAHGAGLSYLLFQRPQASVIEVQTPGFNRPHFGAYSHWSGQHWVERRESTQRPSPEAMAALVESEVKRLLEA